MAAFKLHRPMAAMLCLCLALLAACTEPAVVLAPLPHDMPILAFGDSITLGNSVSTEQSYPAVLATLTGRKVINAGVSGEVSASGRERLPALLARHQPGLLILCHGGNDLLRKLDPTAIRTNLQAMIEAARARNIPVLLLGVPQPGLFLLESATIYDEIAAQHGLLYDGDILPEVYSDNGLKSDQIHPNAAGYQRIAESLLRTLQRSGALE